MQQSPTAKIIIIGNEILSGKTQDENTQFIAQELCKLGIKLTEVRVIADIEIEIIKAIRELKTQCTYLFTTGGIGPTHDDITSESIAKALNRDYLINEEAEDILRRYYYYKDKNNEFSEANLKMAYMPEGAELIPNKETTAPGFKIENIYVLAGVPFIMQSMFKELEEKLIGGKAIISHSLDVYIGESRIAKDLAQIQKDHPNIELGSYPFIRSGKWGTTIVVTSTDQEESQIVLNKIHNFIDRV
jgi:molybdenum cofactor synthesis domain-containing protein